MLFLDLGASYTAVFTLCKFIKLDIMIHVLFCRYAMLQKKINKTSMVMISQLKTVLTLFKISDLYTECSIKVFENK